MAATIRPATVSQALRDTAAALHDLSDYHPAHPEQARMERALDAIGARANVLLLAGDPGDDLGPLLDDLGSLRHCAESWMWAADNGGGQRVLCRDVLDRHAPRPALVIPRPALAA